MQGELTKDQEIALDDLAEKMVEPDSDQVKSELAQLETEAPPEEKPSEAPEDEQPEESDEAAQAKKNGYASRIDQLTRLRREAEEREYRALEELEALKQAQAKQGDDPQPKQDQFEDYAEFVRATARWEGRQVVRQEIAQQKQNEAQQSGQQRVAAQRQFENSRMEEGTSAYPEFEAQAKLLSRIVGPQHEAYHALFESEQFPELVMYLASNLNEAVRITGLSPRAQLREIIRLEDKISRNPNAFQPATQTPQPAQNSPSVSRRISQAPPPPRVIGGGRDTNRHPANESMNDYATRRLAELRAKRR